MCKILVTQVHSRIGYFVKLVAQIVKNLPAMQETQVQSLGWEDPLEKALGVIFMSLSLSVLIFKGRYFKFYLQNIFVVFLF